MSRSAFFQSVYSFITSAGVAAAGTAAATIYLGKRYQENHGHHHPIIQKFNDHISPIVVKKWPLDADKRLGPDDLPCYLVEDQANRSDDLNGLLLSCRLSGTRPSNFAISMLDNKVPIEDVLEAIENDNELATSGVILYNNPESSFNLAHIAAMSTRKLEEKACLIEFLQQKGVDIDAKDPIGKTIYDMCPDLYMLKMPETIVGGSEHGNIQHEPLKEDSYSRFI